jgi:carbonic anhydrase
LPALDHLFKNNHSWADRMRAHDADFFDRLSRQQRPEYLWIGCADSRVPANEIIGLLPGEVFVHRNVANIVIHTDFNCLSVLQYAVEVLQVKHIIVCGHYGCGGIAAALQPPRLGLIDNWLRQIKILAVQNDQELSALGSMSERLDRLCELNVKAQVEHVGQTSIVQEAWRRGQPLSIHGWIYRLGDGLLHDLGVGVNSPDGLDAIFRPAKH